MAKKPTTNTEMTEKPNTAMAAAVDFGDSLGGGMEGTDIESFAIPFLRVLQSNSPQVEEGDAAYVEGARPGMLFNSVTQELFSGTDGIIFLPCAFQRRFIRWAPRGADQGFKGEFLPEDVAQMRADGDAVEHDGRLLIPGEGGELDDKKCDRLVDTRSHFGLVVTEEGIPAQVVMPLASTQIKKSKQLMAAMNQVKVKAAQGLVTPPTWYNRVHITTAREQNDQGTWYGVQIRMAGAIESQELFDAGRAFHDAILGGTAHADFAADEAEGAPPASDGKF